MLSREALEAGDFTKFAKAVTNQSKTSPRDFWASSLGSALRDVEKMGRWLKTLLPEGKPLAFTIARGCLRIAQKARELRGNDYISFYDSSGDTFQFDWDVAQRVAKDPEKRALKPDFSNAEDAINGFLEMMSSYKRRIAYEVGLLELIDGKNPDLQKLVSKSPLTLERKLVTHPDGLGAGLILGEEYNHIRNAIAHSYKIDALQREIYFRDADSKSGKLWEGRYSHGDFVVLHLHAAFWGSGWMMSRVLERAELVVIAHAEIT